MFLVSCYVNFIWLVFCFLATGWKEKVFEEVNEDPCKVLSTVNRSMRESNRVLI